jgi:hypothetical protein
MDAYRRNSKEWGSKDRKRQSREAKSTFRQEGRREADAEIATAPLKDQHGRTIDYEIRVFKGRKINMQQAVRVYRNLHQPGRTYSIWQNGYVVGHAETLMLTNAAFIVSEAGRQRVLATGRKNVHAFIEGWLSDSAMGIAPQDGKYLPARITYNPRRYSTFVCENLTLKPYVVTRAMAVCFNEHGVTAAYTEKE